ncbi:TPM domain-containing protein [Tenacibaculum xiamenense]|uniref:TPM domain-containing protein n=1 Tax=Tenacibaculum xiamenense TaxID=1261553 RepID=UPI00389434C9
MKIIQYLLLLFICLNFSFCRTATVQKDDRIFDFNTVEKYRITKENSTIVNDYDFIFNHEEELELTKTLHDYNIKTTNQIVIVTVGSIEPYKNLQKFASDLGRYWGVGTKEKDNGLIIVLCKPCRKISIATGFGTEKILTDEICAEIIDNTIIPEFKKDNYYSGVKKGLEEIIRKWK